MGNRVDAQAHSQAHDHGPVQHHSFQNAYSPSLSHLVEKLVRLKNADPELFAEAWNKLPGSARENILSYLKKYPRLLEGEFPLLLLHRAGDLSKDEVEEVESRASTIVEPRRPRPPEQVNQPIRSVRETARRNEPSQKARSKTVSTPIRPLHEQADATRLGNALTWEERESTRISTRSDPDSLLLAELRKISRQNRTQIDLMRRLVETSKGKNRTTDQ
jgi:hypothetical protein